LSLYSHSFELTAKSLSDVRRWVRDRCSECRAGDRIDLDKVEIAVGEVLQNIIRYAYSGSGPTDIRVCDLAECVSITVFDHAPPNPIDQWTVQSEGTDGGFGLNLIKECSDAHRFRALDSGNRCSLYFFADPEGLPVESLLWAGELLEAEVTDESMSDWCKWSLSTVLAESDFLVLRAAIDAVESFENSSARVPEYHNLAHFRDVVITVCHVIEAHCLELSRDVVLGTVLAAILHDFGHPGRKASYPGEFEDATVDRVLDFFEKGGEECSAQARSMCLDLIRGTSPAFGGAPNESQRIFNVCDKGASFIPWRGPALASLLCAELGEPDGLELWRAFIMNSAADFQHAPRFIRSWYGRCKYR